jgi:virginiamycin B lyase
MGMLALAAVVLALSPSLAGADGLSEPRLSFQLGNFGEGMRATALTTGPDGNLWFAGPKALRDGSSSVVGRVSVSGQVTDFPVPSEPSQSIPLPSIATGPDGNLWFVEPITNEIGRATLSGQLTEFPLPTPGSAPNAIVAGPDGGIWFTEEGTNRVGRIDSSGKIAEFALPPGAGPGGIALGSDGSLWVTESGSGGIARVTVTGTITQFHLPDEANHPNAIVAGPDGNLWFTDERAARIGRITTAGEIAEFRVAGRLGTNKISTGPAGDLWFTVGNAIDSITPSGVAGKPACIDRRACRVPIASLAEGPEGSLWFGTGTEETEGGGGTILAAYYAPGFVAKFSPLPPEARIGPSAGRVVGARTSLMVKCAGVTAGDSCAGRLRLMGRIRRRSSGNSGRTANVLLAQRRYRLAVGPGHRFALRLTGRAMRLLSSRNELRARAITVASEGLGTSRRVVIRASFQRP